MKTTDFVSLNRSPEKSFEISVKISDEEWEITCENELLNKIVLMLGANLEVIEDIYSDEYKFFEPQLSFKPYKSNLHIKAELHLLSKKTFERLTADEPINEPTI